MSTLKRTRSFGHATVAHRRKRRRTGKHVTIGTVKKLIKQNVELKFLDTAKDDLTVDISGVMQGTLVNIPQGDADSTRDGRAVMIKSLWGNIKIAGALQVDNVDIKPGIVVRIIIHVDRQTNGAQGAVTSLLEVAEVDSFYNLTNTSRYRILYDEFHTINYLTSGTDGVNTTSQRAETIFVKVRIPDLNIKIEYGTTSGLISANTQNSINVLYIASEDEVAAVTAKFRVRYTD